MSMNLVRLWWQRYFSDPQALILLVAAGRRTTGCSDDGRYAGTGVCQHRHRLSAGRYSSQAYSPEPQSVNLPQSLPSSSSSLFYLMLLFWLLPLSVDPGQPVIAAASQYDFCKSAGPAGVAGKISRI